jgi:OOP family OmpA-OmpF porin
VRKMPWLVILIVLAGVALVAQRPMADFKGFKDPALFTRMPGFVLPTNVSVKEEQFGSYPFRVLDQGKDRTQPVEGRLATYKYIFDMTRGAVPSKLQIIRNYQSAAAALGGKVLFENPNRTTILIVKDGKETWVDVTPVATGSEYTLTIVERQAMKQDVVADAAALKAGLAQSGHVEVPGIFFDTGKSEVKPESTAALKEIATLLKNEPAVRVWVVGHTDNTGVDAANVALSQARAAAVVKALVTQMGVATERLAPQGVGPYAPVAPNTTDEGRAKNRRVELVARQ